MLRRIFFFGFTSHALFCLIKAECATWAVTLWVLWILEHGSRLLVSELHRVQSLVRGVDKEWGLIDEKHVLLSYLFFCF